MLWHKPTTIAACVKGHLSEVLPISYEGRPLMGLRCAIEHVFLVSREGGLILVCTACDAPAITEPALPVSNPGNQSAPLFIRGTQMHATWVLSWITRVAREHEHPKPEVEA